MNADNNSSTSSRIVTLLIAGTLSKQYIWTEVKDENQINRCLEELGPSSRLVGKIFSLVLSDMHLRILRYRDYVQLRTKDNSSLNTSEGSLLVVSSEECRYILEFYDPADYSSQLVLQPSNSVRDLYDIIMKMVFPVNDFLKTLEELAVKAKD